MMRVMSLSVCWNPVLLRCSATASKTVNEMSVASASDVCCCQLLLYHQNPCAAE
jgi:hypothetical protein